MPKMETRTVTRRHDLDWLRVLAVLLLIPFHAALIWGSGFLWIKLADRGFSPVEDLSQCGFLPN